MTHPDSQYEIGMVGLGVMGRNLLLNMADHGFSVAGYDKDPTKVEALRQEAEKRKIRGGCGYQGIHRTAPSTARSHDARPGRSTR